MLAEKAEEFIRRKLAGFHAFLLSWAGKLEAEAKQNAPWNDQTGHARQAIHAGVEVNDREFVLYLAHGKEYGVYLETGTGAHGPRKAPFVIRPKEKKALFWVGADHPVKKVTHPGLKARPIIGPTMENNIERIKKTVLEYWEE